MIERLDEKELPNYLPGGSMHGVKPEGVCLVLFQVEIGKKNKEFN
jgi:hypothetical protein